MCWPLVAAAVLAAGAAAANNQANNAVQKARNDALTLQNTEQKKLQDSALSLSQDSAAKVGNFQTDQTAKQQQLGDVLAAQSAKPLPTGQTGQTSTPPPIPGSSDNVVNQEEQRQMAKANAYTGQQAKALGNMRSFGDTLADDNLYMGKNDAQIAQADNFMKGDAAVLPIQLEAANNAGNGWRTAGTVMGGLSAVASMGAGAGLGAGAAAEGAASGAAGASAAGSTVGAAGLGTAGAAATTGSSLAAGAASMPWYYSFIPSAISAYKSPTAFRG